MKIKIFSGKDTDKLQKAVKEFFKKKHRIFFEETIYSVNILYEEKE